MVSFEIFVKAMPPSLSELKVLPSFCCAFKIPDDRAVTNIQTGNNVLHISMGDLGIRKASDSEVAVPAYLSSVCAMYFHRGGSNDL